MIFEWDPVKERQNIEKHGLSFRVAQDAFFDENRITAVDEGHIAVSGCATWRRA